MNPTLLDHVALWVDDRDALADLLCDELDVHVIDHTERYTLVGPNAKAGKLTLFDSPSGACPEAHRLVSVTLAETERSDREPLVTDHGLTITFRPTTHGTQHALVGLTLRSSDPLAAAGEYVGRFGFDEVTAHPNVATVACADATVTLVREDAVPVEQPILNHLGLLVDSARDHLSEARDAGMHVLDIVDAPNTHAVFIEGPEGVSVEYVEHKPAFALA